MVMAVSGRAMEVQDEDPNTKKSYKQSIISNFEVWSQYISAYSQES